MSLSDFITLSKIGQGAYSSVHKVKRISDEKIYALKKVKMNNLKQKQKQNALNQVRLLASITNEYIIGYKQAFFDSKSNCLCIIMQYADGGDLQKYIQKRKKSLQWVPESQIWKVIKQIATGLCVLHDMKIIHRDLKSANIFKCGGDYRLGDLNVSKLMKKNLAYTQTGTPYYASPEVWKDQPYELKSDIWSLGCIIYELCALKPPFTANSMEGLYKKVLKGFYARIPHTYTKKLEVFISKCLKQNANERPSAKDLLKLIPEQNQDESQIKSTINLLNTIKVPPNLKSLREELPKSKYYNETSAQKDEREESARFDNVSQERLKQIVKLKRQQLSRLKQKKRITPDLHLPQKLRENRQNNSSLKKNEKTEVLPKIKLYSEPNDQIHIIKAKDVKQDDRIRRYINQYNHNRPSWWG